MKTTPISSLLDRAKSRDSYWVESAILDFTEEIVARMDHLGVNKSELAKRLGKKPSFITKLLRGNNNFTMETMVKLARKLDSEVRVHLQPDGTLSEWIDFLKEEPVRPAPVPEWGGESFVKVLQLPTLEQPNERLATAA